MKISYLTWLHEITGVHSENIEKPDTINTISELISHLENQDVKYRNTFKNKKVIYCALNGETVDYSALISNSDHLSFYSAIVGG